MKTKEHHGADGVSHTYAILDLSPESYKEIRLSLIAAGYGHAIEGDEQGEVIDMSGIAVSEEEPQPETSATLDGGCCNAGVGDADPVQDEPGEPDFIDQLSSLLNYHSRENESDTPDFLLARFLEACLKAYGNVVKKRDEWMWKGKAMDDKPEEKNETRFS